MILKIIFCPAFLQFWCNVIVSLLIKTDSTVICVPCMLEHVCYLSVSFPCEENLAFEEVFSF